MKFSLVVPTYNRQEDLQKCLASVIEQEELPDEILIIDDSVLPGWFIDKWQKDFQALRVSFLYYQKNHDIERRGLSESKNKALELVNNSIFFVIDDDVVLEKDFFRIIMDVWRENKDNHELIGVGGVIINRRRRGRLEKIFHSIFALRSRYAWDVTRVGFQVWNEDVLAVSKGYYAHGGVCSYNRDKAKKLGFSVFSGGRTGLEDVDFCLRAKNYGYYFLINPRAGLRHYPSTTSREGAFAMGYKESVNRIFIFRSFNKKPGWILRIWFGWSMLGWILRQILVGNWPKARGMISGIFS